MRRSNEHVLDEIFFLGASTDAPLAAARLVPVRFRRGALDVPRVADGDQHLRVSDQILEFDFIDLVDDLRPAVIAVRLLHFLEFAGNDLLEFLLAREDLFQFSDQLADGLQFLKDLVNRKLREAMQLQFQDRVYLHRRQADHAAARRHRFDFERAELVLAAVEFDAGHLPLACRSR